MTTVRALWVSLVVVAVGCGPEAMVTEDETATISSELRVSHDARPYGIERLWDQQGRQLLVPQGMYVIGSRSGADNPDTNYWTKGGSATHLRNSLGQVGPAYTMRTRQVSDTTIEFQVSVGPLPFPMNALSLTFDWDQARVHRFKYAGSSFRDSCRAGTFRQTDVGYDELPQCHIIKNERGEVVARAGAAKVNPAAPWVEFTGDFEGRLRVTFTSLGGATSSDFFNHSGTHAFGLEFAGGRGAAQGATYAMAGVIELLPATSAPPPATPPPGAHTLRGGQGLTAGQALTSANGRYRAVLQADGNLVLFDGARATWSTQTAGRAGARAAMQGDGNFVLYQGTTAVWNSGTHGRPGAVLTLQDSGALAVLANGVRVWSSQGGAAAPPAAGATQVRGGATLSANGSVASPNGRHRLVMQGNGDLVLLRDGAVAWSTGTAGRSNVRAVMQADGNFVLYQGSAALWSTGTHGRPGAVLELRNDGALAVVQGGAELWRR